MWFHVRWRSRLLPCNTRQSRGGEIGTTERPGLGLRWDGTINISALIAMVGISISVIAAATATLNKVSDMQSTMEKQGSGFSTRLEKIEEEVNDLSKEMAVRNAQASAISDHEGRLRALESK